MDWVLLIGRILFASLFVSSGVMAHLVHRQETAAYARSLGAPAPELLTPLSGVAIIVSGVMIVLGLWVDLAALVIIAFLLSMAYYVHAFWKFEDPQMAQNQMAHFMKNLALAGGALVLFFLFQQFGEDIGLTIEPALFD
jgi:putative oxidoreductase